MVKKRIDELDAIAGASTANDDLLIIYDVSAATPIKSRRILRSQLAIGLVGDLPYTPSGNISATTIPTAIAELDSEKAKLAGGNSFTGTQTVRAAATQDGIALVGRSGGSSSYTVSVTCTGLTGNRTFTLPDSNTVMPIVAQTLTISGLTAARTVTLPDANITVARTDAAQTFTGTQTVIAAATQDAVALAGRAGGTGSYIATITPTTLTANRTVTLPDADITVAGLGIAQTFTAAQTFQSGVNLSAANIVSDTVTGTRIGTATTQLISFYNAIPIAQPTAVANITTTATTGTLPTPDGVVTIANAATPTVVELLEYCVELEAKLEDTLLRLRNLGLIAP